MGSRLQNSYNDSEWNKLHPINAGECSHTGWHKLELWLGVQVDHETTWTTLASRAILNVSLIVLDSHCLSLWALIFDYPNECTTSTGSSTS